MDLKSSILVFTEDGSPKNNANSLTRLKTVICGRNKVQFAIEVNVDAKDVIYCSLNNEEDEKANIWINQDGMWFKIIEIVTIVIDPGHGFKVGSTGTE